MNNFRDLNNQPFNLKNVLRTDKQIIYGIIILLIMLPLSFIISKICFRTNLFLIILESAELILTKRISLTRSKRDVINYIRLGGLVDLAELVVIVGVLVKFCLACIC